MPHSEGSVLREVRSGVTEDGRGRLLEEAEEGGDVLWFCSWES